MGVFAYYDTDTESVVYHVVPSPESAPSTLHSETESMSSRSTIESDDLPGYFSVHHERQYAASHSVVRWFPLDNIRRYVVQYFASNYVFGGDYIGPVADALAPVDGRRRQALELGTKAGTWIQAMATQFPHVQFRTLDVAPVTAHVPRQNIAFEVYDFTSGILLEDGSQDAVFLNIVLDMVKDYRTLFREAHRVLRPGGLIYVNDYSPGIWDPNNRSEFPRYTNPRGCYLHDLIRQFLRSVGMEPDTCDKLPGWLAAESDFWDNGQKGFEQVELVPYGDVYAGDMWLAERYWTNGR
ncbi:methyltransferase domain protein [Ceratobasidium sp. AG-Ba]|nr:methyltransferase domain protein [Ceratobasidium sp. AG-Ba]